MIVIIKLSLTFYIIISDNCFHGNHDLCKIIIGKINLLLIILTAINLMAIIIIGFIIMFQMLMILMLMIIIIFIITAYCREFVSTKIAYHKITEIFYAAFLEPVSKSIHNFHSCTYFFILQLNYRVISSMQYVSQFEEL